MDLGCVGSWCYGRSSVWKEKGGRPQSRATGQFSLCLYILAENVEDSENSECNSVIIMRLEFGEVSGHRVLIKRGPGNRGPTECGTTHEATSGRSS